MIRLRPFHKMSYNKLRMEYLRRLVDYNVVEFDKEDILGTEPCESEGKSDNSYEMLKDFPTLRQFLYNDEKKVIKDNLRQILIGPDEAPKSFGGKSEVATMRNIFDKIISNIEGNSSNISETAICICNKIFKYNQLNKVETISSKSQQPLAYWLQSQLDVKVCPYCNRMYTTTLYGKKRIRPDFDHFYPQSRYPYLAVSLFNLIPSCNVCNKAKLDYAEIKEDFIKNKKTKFTYRQKKSIIYPYDESYNESHRHISFCVIPDETQYEVMRGQSDKFTIELRPTEYLNKLEFVNLAPIKTDLAERFKCQVNSEITADERADVDEECAFWERAKQTIELLRLENFYNEHKLEIMKILRIHYEYNRIARQLIMHPLNVSTDTALMDLMSIRDLLYFAFLQPEDWGNTPLNKLKSDILKQLEEIENTRIDSDGNIRRDEDEDDK